MQVILVISFLVCIYMSGLFAYNALVDMKFYDLHAL